MENTLYSDAGDEIDDDVTFNKEAQRQPKRRTASSEINMFLDSDDDGDDGEESTIYTGTTGDSSVDLRSRRPVLQQRQQLEKRGRNKSVGATVHATSVTQAENLGYMWERNGDNVGLNFARNATVEKVGGVGNTASSRCSVSEDVLAAWGSLGGWRDVSI